MSFGLDWLSVSATVLIASPEHLTVLKERNDLEGAVAFTDAEALRALDVITRQKPGVVALERVRSLSVDQFADRAADVRSEIPLGNLNPGEHLLSVEARAGKHTAQHQLRFSVIAPRSR